jgi:hypothetical protein
LPRIIPQLRAPHCKNNFELAMSVGKEEDEDGGASREWTVIPLRLRRVVCAETVQRLLLPSLAGVGDVQDERRMVHSVGKCRRTTDLWERAILAMALL